MGFHKFDKRSVRILDIGEMAGCFTHVETAALVTLLSINSKRKSLAFAVVSQIIHAVHVITDMNKTRIAPHPVFIDLFTGYPGCAYKFYFALPKYFTECSCKWFGSPEQHPSAFPVSPGQSCQIIINACYVVNHTIITKNIRIDDPCLIDV